jgi:prepilin-type N-terminal cleavage/methylation domain-containing protein
MYSFRKSKKGFTLIELMVVVMIIGVLVLLGLRAYSSQKERALNAIVKANAGTIQTMLVGYLGDKDIAVKADIENILCLGPETQKMIENMVNPYDDDHNVYRVSSTGTSAFDTAAAGMYGMVDITIAATNRLYVNGRGKRNEILLEPYSLPANKY